MITSSQQDPPSTGVLPAVAKKRRILIVDDDPSITTSFGLALEDSGLFEKVDMCNDPALALSNFRPDKYDIALLDVEMPDLNGYELYNKIREIDNKVRVCFITAQDLDYSCFRDLRSLTELSIF
jgi:DNA-binding response OmpR family regulator